MRRIPSWKISGSGVARPRTRGGPSVLADHLVLQIEDVLDRPARSRRFVGTCLCTLSVTLALYFL